MSNTQVRELTAAHQGASARDSATPEPSHIHIPRPSRLRQSAASLPDNVDALPLQLDLDEAEAA